MATKSRLFKKLNSPLATGGMGSFFEAHVQASFLILMMTGGYAPCIRPWPIIEIKLQGRICGYDTDDLIVFTEDQETNDKQISASSTEASRFFNSTRKSPASGLRCISMPSPH